MSESEKPPWTVEAEVCKIAGKPKLGEALHSLGLLRSPSTPFSLEHQGNKWVRGGAETYLSYFSVLEETIRTDVLIKACIAFAPGSTLDDILASWIDRRKLLATNGISSPKLYGWGNGVVIEEFVPKSLSDVLAGIDEVPFDILHELTRYAATLSKLGFAPIGNPFRDLRFKTNDIIVVDFGEDLGPAGLVSDRQPEMFQKLSAFFKNNKIEVGADDLEKLKNVFESYGGVI
jgi:hypothetical protein